MSSLRSQVLSVYVWIEFPCVAWRYLSCFLGETVRWHFWSANDNLKFQSKFSLLHAFQANFKQWFVYHEQNMTENPTSKNFKFLICTILLIINFRCTHVIVLVFVSHVTCLFCKLCDFFGVSVKIMCLTWNFIQSLDYWYWPWQCHGQMMDGVCITYITDDRVRLPQDVFWCDQWGALTAHTSQF